MRIALIVVGFNTPDAVARCLAAVAAGTRQPDRVLVVENGSAGSFAALERVTAGGTAELIHAADNPGYAGAINLAMARAGEVDAYWILNPDTEAAASALAALAERMAAGADVVGGRIANRAGVVESDGGQWRGRLARAVSINKGAEAAAPGDAAAIEARLDYVSGASMLVSRAIVERAGGFPDAYFLYAEEVEWCLRARRCGARFGYAPGAVVVHDQGGSTGSAATIHARPRLPIFLDERNKLNVVRDSRPGQLATAIPGALALLLLRYGRQRAWRQLGFAAAGWLAGVRGRRGKPDWVA